VYGAHALSYYMKWVPYILAQVLVALAAVLLSLAWSKRTDFYAPAVNHDTSEGAVESSTYKNLL